jgi:hypothetical protein
MKMSKKRKQESKKDRKKRIKRNYESFNGKYNSNKKNDFVMPYSFEEAHRMGIL